jgi:proline iminopeptidase
MLHQAALAAIALTGLGFTEPLQDPYAEARQIVADLNRIVTPDGVQEDFVAVLGGTRQAVSVRGNDRSNPILLFVHGGPGAVEMPIAWTFQRPWEDYFTVVQWDQRGAGKSYALNDPTEIAPTLRLERYRDDTIELIEKLRNRYDQQKVILLGHSWGSLVGLSVAAARPDLLHAYVGTGQIIDMRENERVGIAWTLDLARSRNDSEAIQEIEALRPYPDSGPFLIEMADGWRKHAIRYGGIAAGRENATFYLRAPRLSPEYSPEDIRSWGEGSRFTVETLWPRIADEGFAELSRMSVPVLMFLGRHDIMTPSTIVESWMKDLDAPVKEIVWFEHSAHLPMVEEPGRFFVELLTLARPLALP